MIMPYIIGLAGTKQTQGWQNKIVLMFTRDRYGNLFKITYLILRAKAPYFISDNLEKITGQYFQLKLLIGLTK